MADSHTGLGELITTEKGRDAVHVAIAPVEATEKLFPSQGVALVDGDQSKVKSASSENWTGIVDPFLTQAVYPGQRFWMWMRPGSITSLRHEWTHPALDGASSDPKAAARARLDALAKEMGRTFDSMMAAARDYQRDGRQLVDWAFESMGMPDGFWDDYELVTGEKATDRDTFFHCGGCS